MAVKPIRWPIYVYLFFDLCILALAGVFAYFAWAQWNVLSEQAGAIQQDLQQAKIASDAAKRSADAAKQSAEAAVQASQAEKAALVASTRPYVVTDKVWLTARLAANTKAIGLVKFINAGKLPALNFHAGGRFKVRDSLPGKLVASGQFPTSLDIVPGGSRTIETSSDAPLTADDFEAVRSGEKKLYGYGILAYDDGFGNQIAEAFCQVYNWKDKTFSDCPQPSIETGESKAATR
ncbi:MAG TPA: hypothetical protein VMB26_07750 [Candidatus Binataceae bacterium]|nr:hypothetical protein [Candidatus Binataceae bacterium]